MNEEIEEAEAFSRATGPVREFMLTHVREKDLALFLDLGKIDTAGLQPEDTPLQVLVPAFS